MKNIALLFFAVICNVFAQVCLKLGAAKLGDVSLFKLLPALLTNYTIWLGIIGFGISLLFWLAALSRVELSFGYAFFGLTQVLVPLAGFLFLHEELPPLRIAGIVIICAGILLVSKSF
ncbi:MAG: EamA family transporter [Spirochaetaceae bacterium]|jgi:multidrug transporter EmrE-like cation transporter|nr:EamA family transporter [Spirochaetaceae bacterium]